MYSAFRTHVYAHWWLARTHCTNKCTHWQLPFIHTHRHQSFLAVGYVLCVGDTGGPRGNSTKNPEPSCCEKWTAYVEYEFGTQQTFSYSASSFMVLNKINLITGGSELYWSSTWLDLISPSHERLVIMFLMRLSSWSKPL